MFVFVILDCTMFNLVLGIFFCILFAFRKSNLFGLYKFSIRLYVLFSESLIENWYNPNELLSLNKDFYLFIYLFIKYSQFVSVFFYWNNRVWSLNVNSNSVGKQHFIHSFVGAIKRGNKENSIFFNYRIE